MHHSLPRAQVLAPRPDSRWTLNQSSESSSHGPSDFAGQDSYIILELIGIQHVAHSSDGEASTIYYESRS